MKLFKKKEMTDYEMQLFLDKKGHKLYDEVLDNEVDMDELHKLAVSYGFKFNSDTYTWNK